MLESTTNRFAHALTGNLLSQNPKIYLAGPDVFYPNAMRIGQINKMICAINCSEGLFPLDNTVDTTLPKQEQAKQIVRGNIHLINQADIVLANLSNFRGTETHLCCDSGTAWECGYGIAAKKIVVGYTYTPGSVPQEILNNIHVLFNLGENGDLFSVFTMLTVVALRDINAQTLLDTCIDYNLNPIYKDVHDANPVTSFYLGMRTALGKDCIATLTDKRSLVEKYGVTDENGNCVENFDYPVNIMMAVTAIIK